jgi:hypothetical protein
MKLVRGRPSLLARATEPLSFADPVVNWMTDAGNDRFPWMWWPAQPPDRGRPFGMDTHAAWAIWTLASVIASNYAGEWALRRIDALPEGLALWRDRAFPVVAAVVMWAEAAGAWERRARRSAWPFG